MRKIGMAGILVLVALAALALLAACGTTQAEPTQPVTTQVPVETIAPSAPTIDAAQLLDTRCSACHSADVPKAEKMSRDQWERVVTEMIGKGAQLSDEEKTALVDYLAATYAP